MINSKNNADELKALIEKNGSIRAGLCRVIIRNQTPPNWNVRIISVGTKFFYRDGGDFTDGPHQVNVSSGGETSTQNNDPSKCVYQEQTFILAVIPGQPPVTIPAIGNCPPDKCILQIAHNVVPKSNIAENDLLSEDISKFLECRLQE